MSKICFITVTTGIISIGLVWYRQMYTFDGNSSLQKVNEVVNRFWTSQNINLLKQSDRKVDKHQIVSNIITSFKLCFGHFSSKYSFFLAVMFVRQMQAGNWKNLMWCKSTSRPSWTFWRELAQGITKLLRTRNESNFKHFPWSQKAGQYLWTADWQQTSEWTQIENDVDVVVKVVNVVQKYYQTKAKAEDQRFVKMYSAFQAGPL